MKHIMDGIVAIDKNDVNLSNANMSSHTPAGQMMTFASEVTKDYTYKYLLPKNLPKRTNWVTYTFMIWITIRPKPPLASNMIWTTCSNADSAPKRKYSHSPIHSKLCNISHYHIPNQPKRTAWRTGYTGFRFFMAKGVRKTHLKHLQTLTDFYREVEGKEPNEDALKK